jgi:hypothetical protein
VSIEDPNAWYSALLEDAMSRVDFGRRIIRQNRGNSDHPDQEKERCEQKKPECPSCDSDALLNSLKDKPT